MSYLKTHCHNIKLYNWLKPSITSLWFINSYNNEYRYMICSFLPAVKNVNCLIHDDEYPALSVPCIFYHPIHLCNISQNSLRSASVQQSLRPNFLPSWKMQFIFTKPPLDESRAAGFRGERPDITGVSLTDTHWHTAHTLTHTFMLFSSIFIFINQFFYTQLNSYC